MITRTWVVENKWRCDSCDFENLGRYMACRKCGSPKEKHEKDDTSGATTAPAVTDPELLRLAKQGPNWVCEYCGGQVRDEHGKCVKNCGAPRAEPVAPKPDATLTKLAAKMAALEDEQGSPLEVSRPTGKPKDHVVPRPMLTGVPPGPRERTHKPSWFSKNWWMVAVGAGLAGVVALLVWFFVPWEEDVTVSRIAWEYREDLHQRELHHGENWKHREPSGSFNERCASKYYGDEDCNPHPCNPHSVTYECGCTSYSCNCSTSCSDNGNGFSTCSETCSTCQQCSTCSRTEYDTCYDSCPVYKPWCSFDYYEWPIVKTLTTSGVVHDEHWPGMTAAPVEQRLDEYEKYEVSFTKPGESWVYRASSLADFKRFETGAEWRIKVNRLRSVTPLQTR